jgi:hypothetical protein
MVFTAMLLHDARRVAEWVRLAPPVGTGAGTGSAPVPGRTHLFATREI